MNIPSNIVRRGLTGGFSCPISGVEFVAPHVTGSPPNDVVVPLTRGEKATLYRQAQAHTASLVFDMAAVYGPKTIEQYAALYATYEASL